MRVGTSYIQLSGEYEPALQNRLLETSYLQCFKSVNKSLERTLERVGIINAAQTGFEDNQREDTLDDFDHQRDCLIRMAPRICICCGEPMARRGNPLSRNPNVCASCSSILDGMNDSEYFEIEGVPEQRPVPVAEHSDEPQDQAWAEIS